MTDPGVRKKKGFFGRLRDFFSGGDDKPEPDLPDRPVAKASQAKTVSAREAARLCGERSMFGPEGRRKYYQRIMEGGIKVRRSDGTLYRP